MSSLVETAFELAKSDPLPPFKNKRRGPTFNLVRSMAYHLSKLTNKGRFILPQKKLAKLLGISQQGVWKIVRDLQADGVNVIECVSRSKYKESKPRSFRYRFTEPIPEPN